MNDDYFVSATQGDAKREQAAVESATPNEIPLSISEKLTPPGVANEPSSDAMSETGGGSTERQNETVATPSDASVSIDDEPLTIAGALLYLGSNGFDLTERTLQRYCQRRLNGILADKIPTSTGSEWHVYKSSLDAYMKANPDRSVDRRQASLGDANNGDESQESTNGPQTATADTATPGVAFDDRNIYAHPYVLRLEERNERLEEKLEKSQERV